jgi:indole-3-pyruvate monooxygenase
MRPVRRTNEDTLVIGAGPAGLAVSATLHRAGVPHLVVEQADTLGSSWRRHYDRLHLHTVKTYSGLPFTPWDREAPLYPSRDQVVRYLEKYARQHHIEPRFGVSVGRVMREATRFSVETTDGRLTPSFVVVCTGYNSVENRPDIHGMDTFAGSVEHSRSYRNPERYRGQKTLVVGCGNSGAEIALDLAEHSVDVSMVVRGPVHVVPRDMFGRPTQNTAVMLSRLPIALRDALTTPLLRLAVGDLSRWGIDRPAVGLNRHIEQAGRVPILDIGTIVAVKTGRIRVVPAVKEVAGDCIRFVNGCVEQFDAIVLATGYKPGLDRFIEPFESIADGRGRPHRFGAETAIPGLFFVGFRNPPTGALREIGIEALRVATALQRMAAIRTG